MNNMEREKLVEQYLNGELSGSQEQDFFIKVAVDNDLRRTLRAYMIVDTAFRVDRDAVASERPAVRARIMSALEASSIGQTATTGAASNATAAGNTISVAKWSLPFWKNAVIAVVATAITVGGYLVGTSLFTGTEDAPQQNAQPSTELRDAKSTTATQSTATMPGRSDARQENTTTESQAGEPDAGARQETATGQRSDAAGPSVEHQSESRNAETAAQSHSTTARSTQQDQITSSHSLSPIRHGPVEVDSQKMNDPAPILSAEDTMKVRVKIVPIPKR
jgi:hypothetical protein